MQSQELSGENFAARLCARMLERGLSQSDVAHALKTAQSTVNRWMKGSTPQPRLLSQLADTLGVRIAWLLDGEGSAPAFDDHLRTLGETRDESMAAGGTQQQQQQRFDDGIRVKDESWRMRAFGLEKKLLEVRHELLRLADQIHEPPKEDSITRLTDGPDEYRTPDKPKP